ncbi:MAG: hypothetical protein KKA79_03290 [Nanoarchaeota archaeon]|nr:hypothetical protein [Nanoarchaeota archaeon]MCG2718765.1 hypothetical protein [Nanoarchaeota archaeon]
MKKLFPLLIITMAIVVLLFAGQALAECPSGYPINCGNVCCPSSHPYCGNDGLCYERDPNAPPECPPGYPINCGDGRCCPSNMPYCGNDGQCYESDPNATEPKHCPEGTLTCITYFCNTDGIYCCPPGFPYLNHHDCLCYQEPPDVNSYSQCTP